MRDTLVNENVTVLDADMAYAERMVRTGFGTPEQAAQTCGVDVKVLRERLAREPQNPLHASTRR
jgi:hypothetical protein